MFVVVAPWPFVALSAAREPRRLFESRRLVEESSAAVAVAAFIIVLQAIDGVEGKAADRRKKAENGSNKQKISVGEIMRKTVTISSSSEYDATACNYHFCNNDRAHHIGRFATACNTAALVVFTLTCRFLRARQASRALTSRVPRMHDPARSTVSFNHLWRRRTKKAA